MNNIYYVNVYNDHKLGALRYDLEQTKAAARYEKHYGRRVIYRLVVRMK